MFLRCKVRRKDGKQHRYWSVVENTRVAGGRVVQRQCCIWVRSTIRRNWRGGGGTGYFLYPLVTLPVSQALATVPSHRVGPKHPTGRPSVTAPRPWMIGGRFCRPRPQAGFHEPKR